MRNKAITKAYYYNLGFEQLGESDYDGYLIIKKDKIEIHFLSLRSLIQKKIMIRFILEPMLLMKHINFV